MKLIHNLVLALTLGIIAVLGTIAMFVIDREAGLLEADDHEDLSAMGAAILPGFSKVWNAEGRGPALSMLRYANRVQHRRQISVRWVGLDEPNEEAVETKRAVSLEPLRRGEEVFVATPGRAGQLILYVPVQTPGVPLGALELTKSLGKERAFVSRGFKDALVTTVLLSLVLGAISLIFGNLIVGRPLRLLADQAHRLGSGDLSARVRLPRTDELGLISREMNRMGDRLEAARKKVEAEHSARVATLEQLRHTDRLATVGELSAGIAHELGTPLSIVIGRSRLIAASERDTEETRRSARVVAEQGDRMATIVRHLLKFARRDPGPKVRADVVPLVRETLNLLLPIARRQGVHLKLEDPTQPEEAVIEANQLEQALTNLVVNGIQSMKHGGLLTVTLREHLGRGPQGFSPGTYLAIEVRDEGEGIAPKTLSLVFDPFFTTKPIGEGTGLGLSVAYGIVRDHGGWIDATSEEGRGSTFTIHLPLAPAQPEVSSLTREARDGSFTTASAAGGR